MSYPAGVTTRTVRVGPGIVIESAEDLRMQVRVIASNDLVWQATGTLFRAVETTSGAEPGDSVLMPMPITDQDGWLRNGVAVDVSAGGQTHTYTATVEFFQGDVVLSSSVLGPFALPDGDSPVDIATLLPVGIDDDGIEINVPDQWSEMLLAAQSAADAAAASAAAASAATDAAVHDIIDTPTSETRVLLDELYAAIVGFKFYSPKNYPGAVVGGGVTSLAAVQAAYDDAFDHGNGCVIIDERYGFDGDLRIPGGVSTFQTATPKYAVPEADEIGLIALTSDARVLYGQGGAGGSVNDNPGLVLNLYVDGANVGGAGDALFVCDAANSTLINLHVRRSAGAGVDLGSSQNLNFFNVQIHESYTGEGVALLVKSRSLGRQGPGHNTFFGGHIGDSLVPIKVTANGTDDYFPPHDNIFEGTIFETGRIAGKAVTCTGIFEAGETVFRSCVATIGASATEITNDCIFLIDNPIFTGYSTTVVWDGAYLGGGAGTVKATDAIKIRQSGAFNEARLKGRTQVANVTNLVCVDGVHLGAGSDFVGSIDQPVTFVTGGISWFRGINGGSYNGLLAKHITPMRFEMPDGVNGNPLQVRRSGDSFNRWQRDRDGTERFLDPATGATVGFVQRIGSLMALGGTWGFAHGFIRAYVPQVVAADTTTTIDASLENSHYWSFTADGADITSITITNPYEGALLEFVMSGSGTNTVTWPGPSVMKFRSTPPQPVNGEVTSIEFRCVGGIWRERGRSN